MYENVKTAAINLPQREEEPENFSKIRTKNLPKKVTVTQTWMLHKEQLTVMDLWHELFLISIREEVVAGPTVSFSLIALDY